MKLHVLVLCLFLLVITSGIAPSQTTFATITGRVTDSTGAVIPNATVTVTNTQTNIAAETQSNDTGTYTVPQLKEGSYTLRVQASGFADFLAHNVLLEARDVRRIDAALEIGAVSTSVEVSAGATLIETESARIGHTKDSLVMKSLPLNSRAAWAFLTISPNVISYGGVYRFAGSTGNQSHWTIDGTSFADGVEGSAIGPQVNYIESFQEMKVDLANNTAEFGAVGQMTIITKSGTNALHGSAADYFHTPFFRARNPFQKVRNPGVYHIYAGSIGGPVAIPKIYNGRDKSFFFFDYEGSIGANAVTAINPTVPLESWRNGDFSSLSSAIIDPVTKQPFPNNRIPTDRLNPVSKKIQDRFYPLPNWGDTSKFANNNYRDILTRPWDIPKHFVVRGDHTLSATDSMYGRFTFTRAPVTPFEGNLPTIGKRRQQRDSRSLTGSWTHLFNTAIVNEFRYGMNLNNNPLQGPLDGLDVVNELGLTGLAPDLPNIGGLPKISFSGLAVQKIAQIDYANPGYRNHNEQFQNHTSWFRGHHSFKFGFDLNRVEYDSLDADPSLFGNMEFSAQYTGHAYADFLLGLPTTVTRAFAPIRVDRNRWQYDFFATDSWKVSPRLTLDLGLRYEMHLPWRENNDRIAMFDVGSKSIVVPDGSLSRVSPAFPGNYVPIVEASTLGLPSRTLVRADKNNIAPRIGAAYRPWGNRTVFRAGWGVYYDIAPRLLTMGTLPYVLQEPSYTNPKDNPTVTLPRVFPESSTGKVATVNIPAAVNPDLVFPYTLQYNFTIEHEQWNTGFRASYIGTALRKGEYSYNYNSPVPDSRLFTEKGRPFPQYPSIMYLTNGAGQQYNALTLDATRQMKSGLFFQTSWTWARDIYDLGRWDTLENPFDRQRERSVAREIPTHRINANVLYQLPFGRGRRFASNLSKLANLAVGGWELSAIYLVHSGQFLTPTWTGPDPTGTAYTTSNTRPSVTIRPDIISGPNLPADQRTVGRWFDTSAFAAPAVGGFGTSAKGVIKGPGVNVWNMGLNKDFYLGEGMPKLRYEVSATNIFNHPNWSNPGTIINAGPGVIGGVGGVYDTSGAREFRMGLRLEF